MLENRACAIVTASAVIPLGFKVNFSWTKRSAPASPKKMDDQNRMEPAGEIKSRAGSFVALDCRGRKMTWGGDSSPVEGGEANMWTVGGTGGFRWGKRQLSNSAYTTFVSHMVFPNPSVTTRCQPCISSGSIVSSSICLTPGICTRLSEPKHARPLKGTCRRFP